jgi:hypothetical protein
MPRININEKDKTSPGTPGGYSNNTVLIAGFSAYTDSEINENPKAVKADDNGIFEFTSAADFEKTIGLVAPTIHATDEDDTHLEANLPVHYGNQMAYELLKMGYPIIYINLGVPYATAEDDDTITTAVEAMRKLGDDSTWEIFKDKAAYDFRFISHGLLTSSKFVSPDELAKSDDLVKLEARIAKMTELLHMFDDELTPIENYVTVKDEEGNIQHNEDGTEQKRTETQVEADARVFEKVCDAEEAFVYVGGDSTKGKLTAAAKNIGYTETFLANKVCYRGGEIVDGEEVSATAFLAKLETEVKNTLKVEFGDAFTEADFADANRAIAKLAHYKAVTASDGSEDEMDPESGRGDCIALIEVDESKYITKDGNKRPEHQIVEAINATAAINTDNGKYCACTVPSVVYKMTADERFDDNKKFPGAFHYLACFKNSLGLGFAEWYAAAGYTRGVSSYTIDHTTVKLGEVAIQALEPRSVKDQATQPKFAVNVIANFRGSYYLWGNRTCHPLGDAAGGNDLVASHFLNIRQLCTTIKKQLYVSCRRFTFDPNSDVLWINFKNSITPMLDRMKADQGVRDYKIEKVYTDKKATLKARIRIVPIEAVEDFLLEVSLEDSLGETAVAVTE